MGFEPLANTSSTIRDLNRKVNQVRTLSLFLAVAFSLNAGWAEEASYFEIQFVDKDTNRGVPLVELVTVHHVHYLTDNAGRIAYREPGHAGESVFFNIHAPGYEVPKDGFGIAGVRLKIEPGQSAKIALKRTSLAERLYRSTGEGLYRDSVMLGKETPLEDPLGSGKVAGQDSVLAVKYRGKLYWFWGDTARLSYPLGLFRMAGATSELPSKGGLPPEKGVNYDYFTGKDGFARAMAEVEDPKGVVWIDGITTVNDDEGKERLVGHFSRRPGLDEAYEQGMMIYNDPRDLFEVETRIPVDDQWRYLQNHPIRVREGDADYLMSGIPFPWTRVPAKLSAVMDRDAYESWSCIEEDADPKTAKPERDADGKLVWKWRKAPPVTQKIEQRWLKQNLIEPGEARYLPLDADNPDRHVLMHTGSVYWNEHRQRYVLIAIEQNYDSNAPSMLGEVYYSEAETPQGPYRKAVKILTHDKQSFYNPCQHPFFDEENGRVIYFEGTYCNTFTNSPATPRYNYNQIVYRLDLGNPKIVSAFGQR